MTQSHANARSDPMTDHEHTMRQFMSVASVVDELLPMIPGHESQCLRSRGMVLAAALGMKSIGSKPPTDPQPSPDGFAPSLRPRGPTGGDDLPI